MKKITKYLSRVMYAWKRLRTIVQGPSPKLIVYTQQGYESRKRLIDILVKQRAATQMSVFVLKMIQDGRSYHEDLTPHIKKGEEQIRQFNKYIDKFVVQIVEMLKNAPIPQNRA